MAWIEEVVSWLAARFVYDEVGPQLDRLSETLRNASVDDRVSAVKQLTFLRSSDAVSLLVGALRDEHAEVRRAAVSALGYKVSNEAVTPIAVLLGDPEPSVRAEAVKALDEIGLPRNRRWSRLWREALAQGSSDPRIPDLLGRALEDTDESVRFAALAILPRHGSEGVHVARACVERLAGEERERALEAAEPELIQALEARDPSNRKEAVEALFALYGEKAVRPISEALSDADAEVRAAAVAAVTTLGPRAALDELLERLDDPDAGVVVTVIEGLVCEQNLGTFGEDERLRIHDELLRVAKWGRAGTQARAAWALGVIGRVASVSTLCELLGTDRADDVRIAACEALGKIADPRATAPLQDLLESMPAPVVATAAIRGLAKTGDVRAVPVLVGRMFSESDPEVERATEEALGAVCGQIEAAHAAEFRSEDAAIRLSAIRKAISEPRLVLLLLERALAAPDEAERQAARETIARQGFDLNALARSALRPSDKSERSRVAAIELVAALRPDDATSLLEAILLDSSEPVSVYRSAAQALHRLGATSVLERHRDDPNQLVREAVSAAMAV